MLFDPFRGADQSELFAVPQREHDGPLRLPALLRSIDSVRAVSISDAAPLAGSLAPFTQAS